MLDLAIRGAQVIDGTGAARFAADVGVADGRVVELGVVGQARQTINADGLIVAPGFIDIHTHYDAQALWDPTLSPSCLHGVTTIIGGNCGFTLAPVDDDGTAFLTALLSRVEQIPMSALEAALDWSWRSFGSYLDRLQGSLLLNAGFLVGHSAVRRCVLRDDPDRAAGPEDIERMCALVARSIEEGALGFSSSWGGAHVGAPSLRAAESELVALAATAGRHPGTSLEFTPYFPPDSPLLTEPMTRVLVSMSNVADRPLNWNVVSVRPGNQQEVENRLAASDQAEIRGGAVFALTMPDIAPLRVNLLSGYMFDLIPGWAPLFREPVESRARAMREPMLRASLADAATSYRRRWADFGNLLIERVSREPLRELEGRLVADVARERGSSDLDVMFDVALADDLYTVFCTQSVGDSQADWERRAALWRDPRVVLGGSDAGAHVDMIDSFAYFTKLIGPLSRDRELITLEAAIAHVTARPAALYGLVDRGTVVPGAHADLVVFDEAEIAPEPVRAVNDLPGGAPRLVGGAKGLLHVLVNGRPVLAGSEVVAERTGVVLRSGRDTRTVTASDALRHLCPPSHRDR
jgi:N-acyl-D-aspartate/D-glutamate deacylase